MATNTDNMERLREIVSAKTVNKRKSVARLFIPKGSVSRSPSTSSAIASQIAQYKKYATAPIVVVAPMKNITPKKDDGKGAQRIIFSCLNQVLNKKKVPYRIIPPDDAAIIESAKFMTKKIEHSHMENVPLISSNNLQKYHTNKKRRLIINLCDRMKSSDPNLVRIRLGCEEIDDDLLKQISLALKKSSYTKKLFLTRNFISDEGVKYLCDGLKSQTNVELLSLGGNLITDIGAELLADLCLENHVIKHLNVSNKWPVHIFSDKNKVYHPHITDIGAAHFARVMVDKSFSLVSLCLSDQRIGELTIFHFFSHNILPIFLFFHCFIHYLLRCLRFFAVF